MGKLLIYVSKKAKNNNFSLAAGTIKNKDKVYKDFSFSFDAKTAVFLLVKKFQKRGISFSEIILNGKENYFKETPLEKYVTVLKKPENFFSGYVELKELASKIRKENKNKFNNIIETIKTNKITTKNLGDRAENLVAEYLRREGHKILARNFKTRFYEIDIVSIKADKIYFTEVKYRVSEFRGSSLDMITRKKLKRMTFAAESFLEYRKDLKEKYSPLLAAASVFGENFTLNDWFIIS